MLVSSIGSSPSSVATFSSNQQVIFQNQGTVAIYLAPRNSTANGGLMLNPNDILTIVFGIGAQGGLAYYVWAPSGSGTLFYEVLPN